MTLAQTKVRMNTSSNLAVVHWNATMAEANELMKARSIRHLPVIDDSSGIVGILSDRDILRAMRSDREQFALGMPPGKVFDPGMFVVNYMTRSIATIDSNASLKEAARLMIEENISSLVVVESGEVVGVTTTQDILKAVVNEASPLGELTEKIKATILQSPVGLVMQRLADAGI